MGIGLELAKQCAKNKNKLILVAKSTDKLWTFLEHKEVPAHNNASEHIIRNQKIHKKIS